MTNVIKFHKSKSPFNRIDTERIIKSIPKLNGGTVKTLILFVLYVLRLPIFLVLYWLRMPILFICNGLSGLMLIAWLFAWYAFPDKTEMVWGFAAISLVCFVITWLYDFVLMAISPQDMFRGL